MDLSLQAREDYQQTLANLATEPGTETHRQGIKTARSLTKNPYLAYPLKQGLESKLLEIERLEMEKQSTVTLPKGTIVHFAGIPCELTADTPVHSASLQDPSFLEKTLHEQQQYQERPKKSEPSINWQTGSSFDGSNFRSG